MKIAKKVAPKKSRKPQPPKSRHFCITTFETKNYNYWKYLDLDDLKIRYFVYQLERASTGKVHVQGYIEFYDQVRLSQVKSRLDDQGLHAESRKGSRVQARDYCMKDGGAWYDSHYPEWETHGSRIEGSECIELGTFKSTQGHRTDLDQMTEKINSGATEYEIFKSCPSQYLKYSTGCRRARALIQSKMVNQYIPNLKVHVIYGDTRSGKTREVLERCGYENVFVPIYSESASKFWFDGYDGQKVLLINEFYGQARTSMMQQLLDHYRMRIESKGNMVISNWDTIYITSNCHPKDWYSGWANIPVEVMDSFVERISTITHKKRPKRLMKKIWDDIPSFGKKKQLRMKKRGSSITPATSEPQTSAIIEELRGLASGRLDPEDVRRSRLERLASMYPVMRRADTQQAPGPAPVRCPNVRVGDVAK